MKPYTHEQILDAQLEARIEQREEYEDQRAEQRESNNATNETGYDIAQEMSYGVRPDDKTEGQHHAFNVKTTEIIYTGTFENCVRAIHRKTLEERNQ